MIEKYSEEPKPEYRSLAFWSLNGELAEDELFRQLLEFKMGGFGGVFLHARGALRTPYLSNLWMEKMHYCMKTAGELGLEAWIYDENNWPSGRAEGAVEKLGGRNVSKKLSMLFAEEFPMAGEVARTSDGKFAFCVGYGEMTNQLSRRTTEDFIGIVYERYKKDCGEFFGNVCPGLFFDEPQYASAYDRNDYVPWADELPDVYSELWKEDIRPELQCLFSDEGDFRRVRKQFWYAVAELYARSWGLPIYQWCGANGLKLTGHYEWEDDLKNQIRCTSDVMRHYEYEHIPGTDQLGLGLYAPWIHLQCASVSQQLGKERTMCECFGVGGQGVTPQERRWMYGLLMTRGVDMFVPHISHYSLAGENKRDCPPYNQYQQPWWHYGRALEDGVAKACRITSAGTDSVSVCILDPIVSAWCGYRPGNTEKAEKLQKIYEELHNALSDKGVYFHYVGESYFRKYASVENGKLRLGRMTYDTVILPGVTDMMEFTAETIAEFVKTGGRLFAVETDWNGAVRTDIGGLAGILGSESGLKADGPCWVRTFELEGKLCRLAANPDKSKAVNISFPGKNTRFTDTVTGESFVLGPDGTFCLAGGAFVFAEESEEDVSGRKDAKFDESVEISGDWTVEPKLHLRGETNCANLDVCALEIDGGGWSPEGYTGDIRAAAAEEKKKRSTPEWIAEHGGKRSSDQDNMRCRLKYCFDVKKVPKVLCAAVETGEISSVYLNGKKLDKTGGYFLDRSFVCYDAAAAVRPGRNELVIVSLPGRDPLIVEDAYLVGNFGCFVEDTNRVVLGAPPAYVSDTCALEKNGFPFFAGELCLKNSFELPAGTERAELELEGVCAAALAVIVNGEAAEPLIGAPWKRDVSSLVRSGTNTVEIRVVNTLRNLFGPLHNTRGERASVSGGDFNDKRFWSDAPVVIPTGFERASVKIGKY